MMLNLSNKAIVASTVIIIISLVTLAARFGEIDATLQTVNPIAAIAAAVVVVIGIIWFKKTTK